MELEFHDTLLVILGIVVYDVRDGPLDRPFGLVVCEVRSDLYNLFCKIKVNLLYD